MMTHRVWFSWLREWLQQFPLSIIQLAMRIGGRFSVLQSRPLEVSVVRVRDQAVRRRVQGACAQSDRGSANHDVQRAHVACLSLSRPRDAVRDATDPRLHYGDPAVRLSERLDGESGVGVNARVPAHTWRGCALIRSLD